MFDLISDTNRELVRTYDVTMGFDRVGVEDVAKRAVFVVDRGPSPTRGCRTILAWNRSTTKSRRRSHTFFTSPIV